MFKKAKRLATIPILAGDSRLKPLQELIAAEELILHSFVHCDSIYTRYPNFDLSPFFSLQGLGAGFNKFSEALKAWAGENKDLEVCQTIIFPPRPPSDNN